MCPDSRAVTAKLACAVEVTPATLEVVARDTTSGAAHLHSGATIDRLLRTENAGLDRANA